MINLGRQGGTPPTVGCCHIASRIAYMSSLGDLQSNGPKRKRHHRIFGSCPLRKASQRAISSRIFECHFVWQKNSWGGYKLQLLMPLILTYTYIYHIYILCIYKPASMYVHIGSAPPPLCRSPPGWHDMFSLGNVLPKNLHFATIASRVLGVEPTFDQNFGYLTRPHPKKR